MNLAKIDSWAIGLTLFMLATKGDFPMERSILREKIKSGVYFEFTDERLLQKKGLMKIVWRLLRYKFLDRATPSMLIQDEYFNGVSNTYNKKTNIRAMAQS